MYKSFAEYQPETFSDLVFDDLNVEQILRGYAVGFKRKNLLLWGQPGSGKSLIAQVIAKDASLANSPSFSFSDGIVINGDDWTAKCGDKIVSYWGWGNPYVVIDEVDELKEEQRELTSIIDRYKRLGSFILTTNVNPAYLLSRLVDRCDVIEIKRPKIHSSFSAVRRMFDDNGLSHYTNAQLTRLLDTTTDAEGRSSWRQIETMVEDEIYTNSLN
jgi:replication-associated recombination protein RarA